MSSYGSHFQVQPVDQVLTSIDSSIRQMLVETGFGEIHIEFEPASNHRYIQIVVKETVHNFYAVPVDDIRQLLSSGPHFSEHYVSAQLWHKLGIALNAILGADGTSHGQIRIATEQKKHQQMFRVSGGASHQFYESRRGMNL